MLKEAVRNFTGTAIIVSHDRAFLSGLVDRVYEFGGGSVRECLGGIDAFLDKLRREYQPSSPSPKAATVRNAGTHHGASETADTPQPSLSPQPSALSYKDRKERVKLLRKAEKAVADAEARIASLEVTQHELEERLSKGESDSGLLTSYADTRKALENAMSLWELAGAELEELQQRFAEN